MVQTRGGGKLGPGRACAAPKLIVPHLKWGIGIDLMLRAPPVAASSAATGTNRKGFFNPEI